MTSKFPQRKIRDASVSAFGLGCMGMTHGYTSGGYNEQESLRVLTRAADLGITFWDTSDVYGPFTNEQLIGKWFRQTGRRDEIFLATKFALQVVDGELKISGDPVYVKKACAESLERLQTDRIDLYYQHRVDTNTPIEKTVQAMVELKNEGKIRYLGLSECSARTMRRAHKIHPIAAVQVEYSPFALEIESSNTDVLQTARDLGIKIVAYSPLGSGFLTGAIKSRSDINQDDARSWLPRFSEEHFEDNLKLVGTLAKIAEEKACTPGQLSLAWVLAQGEGEIMAARAISFFFSFLVPMY
jgi:aryl-alcohol dehydrogenase-like predicted oxidoreductase